MSAGKGDTPRPVKGDTYRDNYDSIFGKKVDPTRLKKWKENVLPNDSIKVLLPTNSNK